MGNLIPELDFRQESAFLQESVAVRNLLGYAVKTLREAPFIETTLDPILTMASIGVEKLHKLALGALAVDQSGKWPNTVEMKRLGHGSLGMHSTLMGELETRSLASTPYVRETLARVHDDPVVAELLGALDTYGRMGRFYYLDLLGDTPQDWVGPNDAWTAIEAAALQDPALSRMREESFADVGNNAKFDALLSALSGRVAGAIENVWDAITVSGRNHILGRAGEVLGFEAHRDAVGRQ